MTSADLPPHRHGDPAVPVLRLLYCAVSVHLAAARPSAFPREAWWRSTEPAVHLAYAATRNGESLIRDLSVKCHTVRTSLVSERAVAVDTGAVTPWPGPVLWWSPRLDRTTASADPALEARTLPIAFQALVDWLHKNRPEEGCSSLRLWFAEESVHLAAAGGYSNPARNDVDPLSHLAWSVRQRPTTVIRDLLDKSREQFHRQQGNGPAAQTAFCAGLLARVTSWGRVPAPSFPRGAPVTAAPAQWSSWCRELPRRNGRDRLWPTVSEVLRTSAVALVQQERDFAARG